MASLQIGEVERGGMRKAETKRYVTLDVAVLFDVSSTPFLLSYGTRLKEGGPHTRVTKFLFEQIT